MTTLQKNLAFQQDLEERIESIEEQLWMLRQEFKVFLTVTNGHSPERLIEEAVPFAWLQDHLARYRFAIPFIKDKAILDMACGTGYGTACMLKEGQPKRAVGADVDAASIRYAQLRYARENLTYTYADACAKWTDDVFDVITSFETIEHVPYPDQMLAQVVQMLYPDGVFFVSTPIRYKGCLTDRPYNPYHMREWSLTEFTDMLRCFFDDISIFGQNWTIQNSFGFARVPASVIKSLLKGAGHSSGKIPHHEICALHETKGNWGVRPNVVVAVCRRPHSATDAARVKKATYG